MDKRIDLNADLGEGMSIEALLMPLISSASIACGGHIGDVDSIKRSIDLAISNGVAIGAHPSLEDKANFGRKEQPITTSELRELLTRQLTLVSSLARDQNDRVHHVKAHGALYHMVSKSPELADEFARVVAEICPGSGVYGLTGSALQAAAIAHNVPFAGEGFLDRGTRPDGSLIPRGEPGADIHDPEVAAMRAVAMAEKCATLCVHGDSIGALEMLGEARRLLEAQGFVISSIWV